MLDEGDAIVRVAVALGWPTIIAVADDQPRSNMTKPEKKQLGAWVTVELFEKISAIAKAEDRSVSSWLRRLIERELKENHGGVGD